MGDFHEGDEDLGDFVAGGWSFPVSEDIHYRVVDNCIGGGSCGGCRVGESTIGEVRRRRLVRDASFRG
jgi:hypothetical protein